MIDDVLAGDAYHESLWRQIPPGTEPEDLELRRSFLLARVGAGQRVLDLGAGEGHFSCALLAAGAVPVAIDVAQEPLRRARRLIPGLDARAAPSQGPLPAGDGEFDVVWAGEVIEHVLDTAAWLSEVRRVLRPSGLLLLSTPWHGRVATATLALRRGALERHFDPLSDHLRFYTRASLARLLEDFGFEAARVTGAGGPPLLRRRILAEARRARW